jgi:hypothetical protein
MPTPSDANRPANPDPGWVRRHRRRIGLSVLGVVVLALAYAGFRLLQAERAGTAGRQALLQAESAIRARDTTKALRLLRIADRDFTGMQGDLHGLGPMLTVGRHLPLLRVQLRGAAALTQAGHGLSLAGIAVAQTSDRLIHPSDPNRPLSQAVDDLKSVGAAVSTADVAVHDAQSAVVALDGYRLLGPLATSRNDLKQRLGDIVGRTDELDAAMGLALDMTGANGPRQYLVLTQNPDEVRPTGGYAGTYGLIDASGGHVRLTRYGPTGDWARAHTTAAIPAKLAPFVFEYASPPQPQTLSNTNITPDFPAAARLAADLWRRGGEKPVNGVLSLEPSVLSRLVAVFGSVAVPTYGETVTAATVQQRIDYYAHGAAAIGKTDTQRKDFIAALAHAVLARMLGAHGSQWVDCALALRSGFGQREAMVWSADAKVQAGLARLGWDGALPATTGDFYADAEFEFAAKNGSGLHRIFDHQVTLKPDGSGISATTMTLHNTYDAKHYANPDSLSYITPYGPIGGVLDTAHSDPTDATEPSLAGHPTAGWVRSAAPLGSTTLTVSWTVTSVATPLGNGTWAYRLTWLPQPGHAGDVLQLHVALPQGWRWKSSAPPTTITLVGPYSRVWLITAS